MPDLPAEHLTLAKGGTLEGLLSKAGFGPKDRGRIIEEFASEIEVNTLPKVWF